MQAQFTYRTPSHLLLVEDNQDDRDHIVDLARGIAPECSIVAVQNGTDAVDHCRAVNVDCVVLDYRLEAEDGLTVLGQLKRLNTFTPIIMLTGQGNEEVAARSIKVGASDYLVKDRLTGAQLLAALEQAIRRAELEKQIADQEEERRQFISTLAHDLKAPMNNIVQLGNYATTEAKAGNIEKMAELLAWQGDVSKRARDLIHTLEIYSLLDGSVPFAPVNLRDAARAAQNHLTEDIERLNATVTIGNLPTVSGHEPQLVQLFQNLIQNGLKYNRSPEPQINVELADPLAGPDELTVSLCVSDNGIGMEPRYLTSIFMPLMRLWTPSDYEGTGLGLAICKKIVERHFGTITCTSTPTVGSKFHISLPKDRPEADGATHPGA